MKKFLAVLAVLLCLAVPAFSADAFSDVVGGGASFNQYSEPQISGNLIYAHKVSEGLYSFNLVDLTSKTAEPFTVTTSITTGLAQYVRTIGRARVYVVGTFGVSAGGEDVGSAFSSGGAAVIPLGSKGWCLLPNVRVLKSSLTSEFQAVYGLSFGWGQQ